MPAEHDAVGGLAVLSEVAARSRWMGLRAARQAMDLLFPPACTLCETDLPSSQAGPLLCPACREAFTRFPSQACFRCAMPVKTAGVGDDCPHCRRRRYHFQSAVSLGIYRGVLEGAVRRMKRPAHEALTCVAARLLAQRVRDTSIEQPVDVVVPVPMHWLRYWTRGINPAAVLAEVVGRELALPVLPRAVRCRRTTRKQGTLRPAARFDNVRNAFALAPGVRLRGARVLLIDDVMTTGATVSEVARVLRRGGAASVRVAVVGRGTGDA